MVDLPSLCLQEATFVAWGFLMPALLVPVLLAVVVDTLACFLDAEGALLLSVFACDATHTTADLLCKPEAG